jgi:predicted TIM-barrel fold metal-dependent hydrolase
MLSRFARQTLSRAASMNFRRVSLPNVFNGSRRRGSFQPSPRITLPAESWDSHMHVIEPAKYPLPKGVKVPAEATMEQALSNARRLGLPNMVFVQVSSYGYDNTWVLNALKKVGPMRGRGVVAFDPDNIDFSTLQQWHDLGVRGVRLNLRSSKTVLSRSETQNILRKCAKKLRPMKTWSIGLYADMEVLDYVDPLLSELDVKIVLEHFASPAALPLRPAEQPGWAALQNMMNDPRVYIKISAPYLFAKDADFQKFESLAKSLLSMRNGDGTVFGSDWPHTQSRGYNVGPFMEQALEWCAGDEQLRRKLFCENARRLWDV